MPKLAKPMSIRTAQTITKPGFHAAGGIAGLLLQVSPKGARSWVFRYRWGRARRLMGLGPLSAVSLAQAREAAAAARRRILAGVDPLEERQEERAKLLLEATTFRTITFREAADRYIAAKSAGWRSSRQAMQWEASLRDHVYPTLGNLPVDGINTKHVLSVVEPIWNTKTETANRVRNRIEAILERSKVLEYRTGDNPARWRGHLENLLPKRSNVAPTEHHVAVSYRDVGAVMVELRKRDTVSSSALQFAILTAGRSGEVIGAKWSEFDLKERLWILPPSRTKQGREHRVPLSDAAMAIVEKMAAIRCNDYLFPGARGGAMEHTSLRRVLASIGRKATPHGFRATFRDWAAERTTFPREAAELALGHSVGDAVEQAYRRGDMVEKRRELASAWSRFVEQPAPDGGEVVPIWMRQPQRNAAG
jgi:integrase